MKTFAVTEECVDLGLRAGAVVLRDVNIDAAGPDLREAMDRAVENIRNDAESMAKLRSSPGMQKLCEVFRTVGVRPRRQPPSVQRLFQYAIKRGSIPSINNLVDAYNLMSLRTGFSMGAHDLDLVTCPVTLRLFRGDETFVPLGKTEQVEVTPGEFGYVDAENRLLCRLDVLQADFSKVGTHTRNALLIIEGTAAHDQDALALAFPDTVAMIQRYCGGSAETVALPERIRTS